MHQTYFPPFSGLWSGARALSARIMANDKLLRGLNIASLLFWMVYYLTLGGHGAVASMALGLAVAIAAELRMPRLSYALLAVELLAIPIAAFVATPVEVVPLVGGVMFSGGVTLFTGTRLTLAFLAGEAIWLVYALIIGAALGVLSALVVIAILGVRTGMRYQRQRRVVARRNQRRLPALHAA